MASFLCCFFCDASVGFLVLGKTFWNELCVSYVRRRTKVRRSAFTASDAGSRPELDDLLFLYAVRDLVRGVQQVQSSPLPIKFQGRHHGLRRPTSSEKWEEKRMEA